METINEITIEVSSEVAQAYQAASSEKRKKIQAIVSILLQERENSDVTFFRNLMDEVSDRAKARGLTPEILESILSDP